MGPQAIAWQDGEWWPEDSGLRYIPIDAGNIGCGSRFKKRLGGLIPFKSVLEISRWNPPQLIERTFKKGPVKGHETLLVEGRYNGTKVTYELVYEIKGPINKLLWSLIFHNAHDEALKEILEALRDYCIGQKRI